METSSAVVALSALAQENRLDVFRLLVQAGPDGMAAGDVADRLEIAPATLSFHLAQLQPGRPAQHAARRPLADLFGELRRHERGDGLPHRKLLPGIGALRGARVDQGKGAASQARHAVLTG
jgi:DNA-binding transcriptional ArsR family regulator